MSVGNVSRGIMDTSARLTGPGQGPGQVLEQRGDSGHPRGVAGAQTAIVLVSGGDDTAVPSQSRGNLRVVGGVSQVDDPIARQTQLLVEQPPLLELARGPLVA